MHEVCNTFQDSKQCVYINIQLCTHNRSNFLLILQGIVLNSSNSQNQTSLCNDLLGFKVHPFSKQERKNISLKFSVICPCKYTSSKKYQFSAMFILPKYICKHFVTDKGLTKHPLSKNSLVHPEPQKFTVLNIKKKISTIMCTTKGLCLLLYFLSKKSKINGR